MGQQFHSESPQRTLSEFEKEIKSFSDNNLSKFELVSNSESQLRNQPSQSMESMAEVTEALQTEQRDNANILQQLAREEQLIQFIGEIIYYCKLQMKKQRKYHYKISALLFYKYFYDKFRQLEAKFLVLYQKNIVSREEYEKKVKLVRQVKETFLKIKRFVYGKIPFVDEEMKTYLDQESDQLCFKRKQFFTQFLYKEVQQITQFYSENTKGQFSQHGINNCYFRMLKAIFIIEELQYGNQLYSSQQHGYSDYQIQEIQKYSAEELKKNLQQAYQVFSTIKHS